MITRESAAVIRRNFKSATGQKADFAAVLVIVFVKSVLQVFF